MTPTLAEILHGNFLALATPATPETSGDFLAARIGVIAMLNMLGAQEAARGTSAAITESREIAALLAAAAGYDIAVPAPTQDLLLTAIDAHNAAMRRALIALHEAAEARGDADLETRILALYVTMAEGRKLVLPQIAAA
jgi:hypothetical protein